MEDGTRIDLLTGEFIRPRPEPTPAQEAPASTESTLPDFNDLNIQQPAATISSSNVFSTREDYENRLQAERERLAKLQAKEKTSTLANINSDFDPDIQEAEKYRDDVVESTEGQFITNRRASTAALSFVDLRRKEAQKEVDKIKSLKMQAINKLDTSLAEELEKGIKDWEEREQFWVKRQDDLNKLQFEQMVAQLNLQLNINKDEREQSKYKTDLEQQDFENSLNAGRFSLEELKFEQDKIQQAFDNYISTENLSLSQKQLAEKVKQQAFDNNVSLENLKLDRAKFSSDVEFKNAQLALDEMKLGLDQAKLDLEQKKLDAEANKPEFQKVGDKVYQVVNGKLIEPKVPLATPQEKIDKATKVLDAVRELEKIDWTNAVGPKSSQIPQMLRSGTHNDALARIDNIRALLTIDNMGVMKGVLSDKDMDVITSASTALRVNMSEPEFEKELERIKNAAKSMINHDKIQTGQIFDNNDGTYSYKNLDGTVHTGKWEDGHEDKTSPPDDTDYSGLDFSAVGGDTNKALSYKAGDKGGQCGVFINKTAGIRVGNNKQDKFNNIAKYGTKGSGGVSAGDVIVQDIGDYGHVAIVTEVLPNGSVKVSESNYNEDEKVGHGRVVKPSKIYGYLRPSKATALAINKNKYA